MKVMVSQAAQAAKMCGKLTADQARLANLATKAKINYADVMRQFVSVRSQIDISYAKPKRKFLAQDIYLPGLTGQQLGPVGTAVDCSGSVKDKVVGEFGTEVIALWEDALPSALDVAYFDSKICHHDMFEPGDAVVIKPHGGGGTAFSPIWQHWRDIGFEPVCAIVLTDLECDDFGDDPGYPVLWVTIKEGTAPFGEVVLMNPGM
jgi:predicted metal-dependent peptidase